MSDSTFSHDNNYVQFFHQWAIRCWLLIKGMVHPKMKSLLLHVVMLQTTSFTTHTHTHRVNDFVNIYPEVLSFFFSHHHHIIHCFCLFTVMFSVCDLEVRTMSLLGFCNRQQSSSVVYKTAIWP